MRRELAADVEEATGLIGSHRVVVRGIPTPKASSMVDTDTPIEVIGEERRWVSRAAHKLTAALDEFDVDVKGMRALDVGSSTGGFTQVLLEAGASHVVALDVGKAQLHESLSSRDDVTSMERTNFRLVDTVDLGSFPVVVADVSFISLCALAENFYKVGTPKADYLLLVKPQFEVAKADVGRGGIVRDVEARKEAVENVIKCLGSSGLGLQGVITSPVKGTDGNVEYLLWLRKDTDSLDLEVPT